MSAAAADFSAAEFVKGLTDEQKEAVLYAIVREVLAVYPKSTVIPLHPEGEELMAHILTPAGLKTLRDGDGWRHLPELLIPVVHDKNPPNGLTSAELWARIDAMEAEQAAQSQSRAAG
jgi:hypothetical protein